MAKKTKKTKQDKRIAKMVRDAQNAEQDYIPFLEQLEGEYMEKLRPGSSYLSPNRNTPEMKMSEIILVFGKPFIEKFAHSRKTFEIAVKYSILVWNLGLLPEEERKEQLVFFEDSIQKVFKGKLAREENASMMEVLFDRQRTLFPQVKKIVKNCEITTRSKGSILNLESVAFCDALEDPDPAE